MLRLLPGVSSAFAVDVLCHFAKIRKSGTNGFSPNSDKCRLCNGVCPLFVSLFVPCSKSGWNGTLVAPSGRYRSRSAPLSVGPRFCYDYL
ncbi:MAG: hypothetical protein LBH74_04380 [Nitrososphaerota archaeon]|nr:hypothetical protein [Nitrososphaerota archaeon]